MQQQTPLDHRAETEASELIPDFNPYFRRIKILVILSFQVTIKNAAGLPPSLSHFVFCQYNFWSEAEPTVVPPTDPDLNSNDILKLGQTSDVSIFTFNHTRQFTIPITEEFMDYCSEFALSIEVYGHRSAGFASTAKWAERLRLAKSLADR